MRWMILKKELAIALSTRPMIDSFAKGSPMKSARISIFCLRQELAAWLQRLMEEKGLGALLYLRSEGSARLVQTKDGLSLPDDVYIAFLAPTSELAERRPLKLNDAEPRIWGWLDLRPGVSLPSHRRVSSGLRRLLARTSGGILGGQ